MINPTAEFRYSYLDPKERTHKHQSALQLTFKGFSENVPAGEGKKPLPTGIQLLDALMWIDQTAFPRDLQTDLLSVGASDGEADFLVSAYCMGSSRSIFKLYGDYAYSGNDERLKSLLWQYIERQLREWQRIQCR